LRVIITWECTRGETELRREGFGPDLTDAPTSFAQVKLWGGYELPEIEAQRSLLEYALLIRINCHPDPQLVRRE